MKAVCAFVFMVSLSNATRIAPPAICENLSDLRLTAVDTAPCPAGTKEWRGAGANLFDVFWAASSGQCKGHNGISYNDSLAELVSAKAAGIRVFRAFASDWEQNTIYWKQHPKTFWSEFDQLVDDIEKTGLSWIPSIGYDGWSKIANALTPGLNETMNDMVTNSSSVSRRLIRSYFEEFTHRYSNRSSILMWELGNELNLMVNLPPPFCGSDQCFNTAQMVEFTKTLVAVIRKVDTIRPISSGYSLPRSTSWHQEHCPYSGDCDLNALMLTAPQDMSESDWENLALKCPSTSACPADPSGYWGTDTQEQFGEMLVAQNSAVGVWSIHHYDDPKQCYFDKHNCINNASLVTVCSQIAKENNASLFVGEFGGPGPNFTGPTVADQVFPTAILQAQINDAKTNGATILTTIWAWECPCHRQDMTCIYPNSTVPKESGSNRMVSIIQQANAQLQSQGGSQK